MTNTVITYRRDDVPAEAHRLHDAIVSQIGRSGVTMADEVTSPARPLDRGDVLVAVIGPRWRELTRGHETNGERDEVRTLIASALRRGLTVVPVRVGRTGAVPALPTMEELPNDIRALALTRSHAAAIETLDFDSRALVAAIRPVSTFATGERMPGNSMLKMWLWAAGIMAATVVFANLLGWLSGGFNRPAGTPTATPGLPPAIQSLWTSEGRIRRAIEAALAKGRRPDEARRCQSALIEATDTGTIGFTTASADLDLGSFQTLDKLAQIIKNCPDFIVEVEGHTDSMGEAAANQRLSERRAGTVRDYLLRIGVPPTSLSATGYGDTRPLVPNDTPANMARNRRIEFNITSR